MKKATKTTKATKSTKKVAKKFNIEATTKANIKTTEHSEILTLKSLTPNQAKAMKHLIKAMAGHKISKPTFSDVGVKEICDLFPTPFVGGAVISTLIERGLVEKHEAPADNRDILGKWVICFTDEGQKLR